ISPMRRYTFVMNHPANDAQIAAAEAQLGTPIPRVLSGLCRVRDGYQIFTNLQTRQIDRTYFGVAADNLFEVNQGDGMTLLSATRNYIEVHEMFATGVDIGALTGWICIGTASAPHGTLDHFTYWMRPELDTRYVYVIEDDSPKSVAPPVHEQLKRPPIDFLQFIMRFTGRR
ncbi:MAG: hypothetical protein AAF125_01810, partial [Chloroflexota bacterium]